MTLRIVVVTGTRADLGLWTPVLEELRRRGPAVEVALLAMAMHLDPRFGHTVDEVRALGFPLIGEVACTSTSDSPAEMAASLGVGLQGAAPILERHRPDWLMVLGDRGEQVAAALAAVHLGIPVAHLHGGERTLGAVDDVLRDLISRMAHLHLVATSGAAERLVRMGIAPWRVRHTGAPGLDAIPHGPRDPGPELRGRYGLPSDGPYLVALVHPETGSHPNPPEQLIGVVLEAAAGQELPIVAIWPNADAGGRAIADRLDQAGQDLAGVHRSIPRQDYLALLRGAAALLGNSSSGIIEAPLLGVPAINVGRRQEGRERGDNVIDVQVSGPAVRDAIRRAPELRARLSGVSPYGDGHAAPRIVDALLGTPVDDRLLGRIDA